MASEVKPTEADIATARTILAPHFATDGEEDNAEMVESLLSEIAQALADERERCAHKAGMMGEAHVAAAIREGR